MSQKPLNPAILAPMPDTPHPRSWQQLKTIGDCRRGLRWLFLQTKSGRMDSRKAATLAVILSYAMKAVELEGLEQRIASIEAEQGGGSGDRTIRIVVAAGGQHESA